MYNGWFEASASPNIIENKLKPDKRACREILFYAWIISCQFHAQIVSVQLDASSQREHIRVISTQIKDQNIQAPQKPPSGPLPAKTCKEELSWLLKARVSFAC